VEEAGRTDGLFRVGFAAVLKGRADFIQDEVRPEKRRGNDGEE
jgi:hypothetical protein